MEKINKISTIDYLYSPSDLIVFMRSQFSSWMDRYKLEQPAEASKITINDDPMLDLLSQKGKIFERQYLEQLQKKHGFDQVAKINTSNREQAASETLEAMRKGYPVIFQGYLHREHFAGFTDFLVRREGKSDLGDYYYEVYDTKLAKTVRPYFVLQLCMYSWMLENTQGHLPDEFKLVFGTQETVSYRLQQFYAYFKNLKDDFLNFQQNFHLDISNRPDPALSSEHGKWASYVNEILEETNSLKLVANIRKSQIKKLQKAGITRLDELADSQFKSIKGINDGTYTQLKAQAEIQKASQGQAKPLYKVISDENGKGLSGLSPASPLDVYFDIEGNPLVEGGLEYLWGISYHSVNDPQGNHYAYQDWWAHTEDQEKEAFEQFIDWVYQRWQQDKTMHIYHYAPYEITAIRKISNRYNTKTEQVDELLRQNVFIDLYKIIKNGLCIGEPKYSLKNVEHLYREKRQTAVASGDDSIVFYDKWRESGGVENWCQSEQGYKAFSKDKTVFDWHVWPELKQIRDYNIDDCESTLELVQWLRGQIEEHNIEYVGPKANDEPEERTERQEKNLEKKQELQKRQRILLERFKQLTHLNAEDSKAKILHDLIEYFVRESKVKAWEYFDRLEKSRDELFDDDSVIVDVKVFDRREEDGKIIVECGFDDSQAVRQDKFKTGTVLEYELKINAVKFEKIAEKTILILEMKNAEANKLPDLFSILGQETFFDTNSLEHKICDVAEKYFNEGKISGPLDAILSRISPVFKGENNVLPITRTRYPEDEAYLKAIIEAVKKMDHTCLCIQGPPGAGKTFTAKHVIEALLGAGKRVGISSNSHAAIMNLMNPLIKKGCHKRIVKIGGMGNNQEKRDKQYPQEKYPNFSYRTSFGFIKKEPYEIFVLVGATAYALCSDEAWDKPLDYLFIDEASQVSLAHLVGISGSAANIVMMGDQMQLEQPTRGAHPGEAGLSALQYFLNVHAVIPEELGIFLERTYRMHPNVCEPLSKVVYEGRLVSDEATSNQAIFIPEPKLITKQNGVLWSPIEHEGNAQSSDEEVDHIQKLIDELLTGSYCDKQGEVSPMAEKDILIVAPYNMQVNLLKERLISKGIEIGTIDKFQGQEAPVVILSMGVSDVNESARGLDFVFNVNRLNVAISRAKALAIIVSSTDLQKCQVSNIKQMEKVSFFCSLTNKN